MSESSPRRRVVSCANTICANFDWPYNFNPVVGGLFSDLRSVATPKSNEPSWAELDVKMTRGEVVALSFGSSNLYSRWWPTTLVAYTNSMLSSDKVTSSLSSGGEKIQAFKYSISMVSPGNASANALTDLSDEVSIVM